MQRKRKETPSSNNVWRLTYLTLSEEQENAEKDATICGVSSVLMVV